MYMYTTTCVHKLVNNRKALPSSVGGRRGRKGSRCVGKKGSVCVKGRQCVQEGWQGEEPYMHPESDKSNVAAVKHKYIHVGAQYEYDINRSITQLPFPHLLHVLATVS